MMLSAHNNFNREEEEDATIDDALLGELDDDALLDEETDLVPKETAEPHPLLEEEEGEEKTFETSEGDDEEDLDYDSFDDHDEL